MTALSGRGRRAKGASGEREIAALIHDLTGWTVKRRIRQHEGDSDLEGIPGWSAEVKRRATAGHAERVDWYGQARIQCPAGMLPVLFYRADRQREWRAVWPLWAADPAALGGPEDYGWTADTSVDAWASVARDRIKTEETP